MKINKPESAFKIIFKDEPIECFTAKNEHFKMFDFLTKNSSIPMIKHNNYFPNTKIVEFLDLIDLNPFPKNDLFYGDTQQLSDNLIEFVENIYSEMDLFLDILNDNLERGMHPGVYSKCKTSKNKWFCSIVTVTMYD